MSDAVKETVKDSGTMVSVEKAGKLLQDAVARTAEVVGDAYEKIYEDKPAVLKTEPAKVEQTPEIKASAAEVAKVEAPAVAAAPVETKTEEQAVIQSTSKEQASMEVKAETKQVAGSPDKPLVSGIGKPTEGIKQPKEGLPEVPGYVTGDKVKESISPAKTGKESMNTKPSGEDAKLVNQSDAFISGLLKSKGLQKIDMNKKIWAALQAKVIKAATEVGIARTGAALDFIVAKKRAIQKKPANT